MGVWRGNAWDDNEGFDREAVGVGDVLCEIWAFPDRIWMEQPKSTFFRKSPAMELLDLLERLAPFVSPELVLRDPSPALRDVPVGPQCAWSAFEPSCSMDRP